ncbi:hypothetical protein BDZ89DRAFT_1068072 [Hymenopellis radicata]|nr:hypothetical protein BDZ89DRAFT_1068072 [Hymenopellis radicata]
MAPNYVVPPNASPAHRSFAQYINSWNAMDLDALAKTMDDEKFMWSMFPTSLNIPPLSKAQAVPYLKDVLLPTINSFVFKILTVTEPNNSIVISHLQGEAVSKLGNVLKNEYLIVLNFVPSKIEGELPKISTYTEFMDSKALTDFQAAEAKAKAGVAAK